MMNVSYHVSASDSIADPILTAADQATRRAQDELRLLACIGVAGARGLALADEADITAEYFIGDDTIAIYRAMVASRDAGTLDDRDATAKQIQAALAAAHLYDANDTRRWITGSRWGPGAVATLLYRITSGDAERMLPIFLGTADGDTSAADALFRPLVPPLLTENGDGYISDAGDSDAPDGWPDPLGAAAYHGLAGEIVRAIEPHTEADPAALLVQLLTAYGSAAGRHSYCQADATKHYPNLFAVLAGATAKGRKGTSWGQMLRMMRMASPSWADERVVEGLSSGEGLIWAVRDKIVQRQPVKSKGRVVDYEEVEIDSGVADKRLLVQEGEFSQVLKVVQREGNTLSPIIRKAWDTGALRTLTKNTPAKATDAHISIIGHITREELRRRLDETECANGFGNRFLWVCVKRSKCLPEGGMIEGVDFSSMSARLAGAIEYATEEHLICRDADAKALWARVYPDLSSAAPGMLGMMTSRAESQAMRLAMIYALLDQSPWVRPVHLRAGLAVWKYCMDSARHLFGGQRGNDLLDWIIGRGGRATAREVSHGIRKYRGNPDRAAADLEALVKSGHGSWEYPSSSTGGRPTAIFIASGVTVTNTPRGDSASGGYGDGDAVTAGAVMRSWRAPRLASPSEFG